MSAQACARTACGGGGAECAAARAQPARRRHAAWSDDGRVAGAGRGSNDGQRRSEFVWVLGHDRARGIYNGKRLELPFPTAVSASMLPVA